MKIFVALTLAAAPLLFEPVVDRAFGNSAVHPDLRLAPVALCIALCPGAPAVVGCGLIGLVDDCLSGPQLGARTACYCLLAALGSMAIGRRSESWIRRLAVWAAVLFVAHAFSSAIAHSSSGGTLQPVAVALDAALSAMATMIFLSVLWLGARFLVRGPWLTRGRRRFSPAIGRMSVGD